MRANYCLKLCTIPTAAPTAAHMAASARAEGFIEKPPESNEKTMVVTAI